MRLNFLTDAEYGTAAPLAKNGTVVVAKKLLHVVELLALFFFLVKFLLSNFLVPKVKFSDTNSLMTICFSNCTNLPFIL